MSLSRFGSLCFQASTIKSLQPMNQYAEKVMGSGDLCVYTGSFYYLCKEPVVNIHTILVSIEMHHIFLAKR